MLWNKEKVVDRIELVGVRRFLFTHDLFTPLIPSTTTTTTHDSNYDTWIIQVSSYLDNGTPTMTPGSSRCRPNVSHKMIQRLNQLQRLTGAYPKKWPDKQPRKGWTSGGHSSSLGQSGVIGERSSSLEQSGVIDKVSTLYCPSSCPKYLTLYSSCATCYSIVNHFHV